MTTRKSASTATGKMPAKVPVKIDAKPGAKGMPAKAPKGTAAVPPATEPALPEFDRAVMVAEAAYYRAERRGFAPGAELEDWFSAEAEIERLLRR